MAGTIAIILWIGSVIGYILFNLYQKNIKLEDMVVRQATFIQSMKNIITASDKVLKDLDTKIWTESDKELANAFQNLRMIQEALNQFKVN